MLVSLRVPDWQILRAVLRAEAAGRPPLGRDLRINPTRKTKDGTFLDDLVADGFLVAVGKPEPVDRWNEPEPFRRRYTLTDVGRHAAEYGEHDRPFTPEEAPLSGTAAELQETLAARRATPAAKPPTRKGKRA
jgi:hypothetical protein